jgi:hypothetical protein
MSAESDPKKMFRETGPLLARSTSRSCSAAVPAATRSGSRWQHHDAGGGGHRPLDSPASAGLDRRIWAPASIQRGCAGCEQAGQGDGRKHGDFESVLTRTCREDQPLRRRPCRPGKCLVVSCSPPASGSRMPRPIASRIADGTNSGEHIMEPPPYPYVIIQSKEGSCGGTESNGTWLRRGALVDLAPGASRRSTRHRSSRSPAVEDLQQLPASAITCRTAAGAYQVSGCPDLSRENADWRSPQQHPTRGLAHLEW